MCTDLAVDIIGICKWIGTRVAFKPTFGTNWSQNISQTDKEKFSCETLEKRQVEGIWKSWSKETLRRGSPITKAMTQAIVKRRGKQ